MMEREGVDKVEVECPPQWDGVAACIPSSLPNKVSILPCIEQYDGQFDAGEDGHLVGEAAGDA